jgi:hypothetical protein
MVEQHVDQRCRVVAQASRATVWATRATTRHVHVVPLACKAAALPRATVSNF